MSDHTPGAAAFPCHGPNGAVFQCGMSLRDWFAGQALAGYNTNHELLANLTHDQVAENAYRDADAMLAARERKEPSK